MNDTILINYKKTILWQRIIAGAIAFTLLIGVVCCSYLYIGSYEYKQLLGIRGPKNVYIQISLLAICFLGFCILVYLNWSLFKAASYLKKHTISEDINDLKEAIRYQTVFWRLFTLSPFIASGLFIIMVLLIALIYNTMRPDLPPPPPPPMSVDPMVIG